MKLTASPVKVLAQQHDIPVLQPHSLNRKNKNAEYAQQAQDAEARLRALELDALVVAAYGLILPQWVLDTPRLGCINIHASLLPRWRGAAPIHRAIEAGDTETGVCIMQMDRGLDTGDVLLRGALPIATDDTTASLHDKLADLGGESIVSAMQQLAAGTAVATPQIQDENEDEITYAEKISKAEAQANWALPAEELERKVRAFNPFPVLQGSLRVEDGEPAKKGSETVIRIWQAQVEAERPADYAPGAVWKASADGIWVACGSGSLKITVLQKRGSKALDAAAFLNGMAVPVGSRFVYV